MQRNFSLFGAPAVAWLCLDRALSPWSLFDLGTFAQSLMLAATELGLDSVPAVCSRPTPTSSARNWASRTRSPSRSGSLSVTPIARTR